MRADALIVNRVRPRAAFPSAASVRHALLSHGLGSDPGLIERVRRACHEEATLAELEQRVLAEYAADPGRLGAGRVALSVQVPAFAESVHDAAALAAVSRCFR
jgi:hypothetical protein